jgi:hypothetical protein
VADGFDYRRVRVADGVALNVAVAGSGSPIVLLHGFPQDTTVACGHFKAEDAPTEIITALLDLLDR